ncbi:MAG: sigma-70 family RNA polymerase sigma factor [Wenzhouxiangella sp.]|nr:MAG: sigma-70 family RNA polymerase sigma factor [Wenzhouxiangella sp.]
MLSIGLETRKCRGACRLWQLLPPPLMARPPTESDEITRLLNEIRRSPDQFQRLIPLMYDDLRRVGHNQRAAAGLLAGPTLQTTALVNEAFLKLQGRLQDRIENRLHFKRLMAKVMRQLIVDYARRQTAAKRGGMQIDVEWSDNLASVEEDSGFTLAVEAALSRLEADQPRQAEVMTASIYLGCTAAEIGEMLDVSERTVRRELQKGRAWMMLELADAF